jgi:signal transduction histidine kinase/PAS domain-containing protein
MANSAAGISKIASTATCYTLTHKRDKPCESEGHACPLEIIKKTKKPVTVEHIHYDQDGDVRNFEVHGFPVFNDDGSVTEIIEYCLDITERKQIEAELRKKQEDLNHAQTVGKIGSWRLDIRKNELTWSDESYRISGLEIGTPLTYESFLAVVHPDDRHYVDEKWKAALQGEPYDIEHRLVVNSKVKWVREVAELEFNKDGVLTGGFGTCQDITDRKLSDEQIKNLAKFPSENPYPVLRISEQGKIVYANNSSVALLKYWGRKLGENVPEDWQIAITESLKTHQRMLKEVNLGDSVVSFAISPVPDGKYANIYGREITEYRRIEQELKRINEQLELRVEERTKQLQKTVNSLEKEVSERLQAEKELIDNQNKLRELSNELMAVEERERHKIATHLHDSIGQLLAFSKKELGSVVKTAPENIRKQLERIWDLIRQSVEQTRNLTFDLSSATLYTVGLEAAIEELAEHFSEKEGLNCRFSGCDQCKKIDQQTQVFLYRAVRELLVNIVKHAQAQNVEISMKRFNNSIYIFVRDDGIGFNASELDGRKGRRGGFGLFSLRERLANIGGNLKIESETDNGTKVTLTAPLKQSEKQEG